MIIFLAFFSAFCFVGGVASILVTIVFVNKRIDEIYAYFEGSERLKYFLRYSKFGGFKGKWAFYNFVVGLLQRKSWSVRKGYVEKQYLDAFPASLELIMKRLWWLNGILFGSGMIGALLLKWLKG